MKKYFPTVKDLLWLSLAWLVITWGRPGEIALKMDAMTYSALAKNAAFQGAWSPLHYGEQAYAQYYQHPPLAIWLQALWFWLLGPDRLSDVAARVLPTFFALGSIAVVYLSALRHSRATAWLAAVVLLISPKFIKYGADFFLDGPLAFLLAIGLWSSAGWARGLAWGAALLTKGVVALVVPAAIALSEPWRRLRHLWSLLTCSAVLLVWWIWGGGSEFLPQYWAQSVSGRLSQSDPWRHLDPFWQVMRGWGPLLGVYAWGLVTIFRQKQHPLRAWAWASGGLLAGFSWVGHSLEHYYVPFYVLAAPVVATPLCGLLTAQRLVRARTALKTVTAAALLVSVFWPGRLHAERYPALDALAAATRVHAPATRRVRVPRGPDGFAWAEMAYIQWRTPWQTVFADPEEPGAPGDVLWAPAAWSPKRAGLWERKQCAEGSCLNIPQAGVPAEPDSGGGRRSGRPGA